MADDPLVTPDEPLVTPEEPLVTSEDVAPPEGVDDYMPGPAELSVTSVLNKEWEDIYIEQRGPDGSEVLMLLAFYACPICQCVIPPPTENSNYGLEHAKYHIKQARDWDVVNAVMQAVRAGG